MKTKIFSTLLIVTLLLSGFVFSANAQTATPPVPLNNTGAGQGGQVGQNDACRPDLTKAAAALNVTLEKLQAALGDRSQGRPDFTAAASTLGVTADVLRQAMDQSISSTCQRSTGGQSGQNDACRPDLTKAAAALNVTLEKLQSALGDRSQGRPDFTAAASTLGVTADALRQAMDQSISSTCQRPTGDQAKQ